MPSYTTDYNSTHIAPIVDGVPYFTELHKAMHACSGPGDFIHIVSWVLDPYMMLPAFDAVTAPWRIPERSLGDLLYSKTQSGVDVRILLWMNRLLVVGVGRHWTGYNTCVWNIHAVHALRKMGAPAAQFLKDRVLLDYSGTRSHHAKYTVVKAGNDETAFVGGLDFARDRIATPGHMDNSWHDIGVKLVGKAIMKVHDDFVTRWKECVSLPVPSAFEVFNPDIIATEPLQLSSTQTSIVVNPSEEIQVLRSYDKIKFMSPWWPDILPWTLLPSNGVREIREYYKERISQATEYIYVEDQEFNAPFPLHKSLYNLIVKRLISNPDICIIFVSHALSPNGPVKAGFPIINDIVEKMRSSNPGRVGTFGYFIVDGVYVHSKAMLVDDTYMSIGSANFCDDSMSGLDSELSIGIKNPTSIKELRVSLLAEHMGLDKSDASVRADLEQLGSLKSILFNPNLQNSKVEYKGSQTPLVRLWPKTN